MKMPSSASFLCASLVLCVAVSHSLGLVLSEAKERRNWTLNSVGYLLGAQAMLNYPHLNKKLNPIGKRDLQFEDNVKPEMGVLDELLSLSSPELGQS
ncbi:galanin peptides-like [Hypanus sabinus]|uniref:galanin peptides-like n=1 Tax=Hypanus sabinus TaxID=79690 RepID=UPI0028C4890E|nr:galanin peptides-like [Hypanus sabinus]XP_059815338.1 galanin peptides-like [Hypanus sabinus]XP_059829921.1 galanin peptides-like [Hypanus sabinus]